MTKDFLSRYAWQIALAIIAIAIWLLFWNPTELSIRLIGLFLQVGGIGTAFWGIISLTSRVKAWLGLPRHIEAGLNSGVLVIDVAHARVICGPGPHPTITTRLDALEKNVTAMEGRLIEEIEEQFRKFTDIVKSEELSRREDDAVILTKLEATATKDRRITLIGASLILVGTIFSTVSGEIHSLIARFPYFGM